MMKPHISVRDHARLDTAIDALNALGRLAIHYRYHQPLFDPEDIRVAVSFGDVAPLLLMIEGQFHQSLSFEFPEEGE